MSGLHEEWYDEFFGEFEEESNEDFVSALRLIGEMFSLDIVGRDGDELIGRQGMRLLLDARDQYLVRRIEDAAEYADSLV